MLQGGIAPTSCRVPRAAPPDLDMLLGRRQEQAGLRTALDIARAAIRAGQWARAARRGDGQGAGVCDKGDRVRSVRSAGLIAENPVPPARLGELLGRLFWERPLLPVAPPRCRHPLPSTPGKPEADRRALGGRGRPVRLWLGPGVPCGLGGSLILFCDATSDRALGHSKVRNAVVAS